jgi:hypothetical protein
VGKDLTGLFQAQCICCVRGIAWSARLGCYLLKCVLEISVEFVLENVCFVILSVRMYLGEHKWLREMMRVE